MPKYAHQIRVDSPEGNTTYDVSKETVIVGREVGCDIELKDASISRKHGKISFKNGKVFIEDLATGNGTTIDGSRIQPSQSIEISSSSQIVFGNSPFTLTVVASSKTEKVITDDIQIDDSALAISEQIRAPVSASEASEPVSEAPLSVPAQQASPSSSQSPTTRPEAHEEGRVVMDVSLEQLPERLRNKCMVLEERRVTLQREVLAVTSQMQELKHNVAAGEKRKVRLEEQNLSLNQILKDLEAQIEKARSDLSQSREHAQHTKEKVRELETQYREFQSQLEEAQREYKDTIAVVEKLKMSIVSLETQLGVSKVEASQSVEKIQNLRDEIKRHEKERTGAQDASELARVSLKKLLSQLDIENAKIAHNHEELIEIERTTREAKEERQNIEQRKKLLEQETFTLKAHMLEEERLQKERESQHQDRVVQSLVKAKEIEEEFRSAEAKLGLKTDELKKIEDRLADTLQRSSRAENELADLLAERNKCVERIKREELEESERLQSLVSQISARQIEVEGLDRRLQPLRLEEATHQDRVAHQLQLCEEAKTRLQKLIQEQVYIENQITNLKRSVEQLTGQLQNSKNELAKLKREREDEEVARRRAQAEHSAALAEKQSESLRLQVEVEQFQVKKARGDSELQMSQMRIEELKRESAVLLEATQNQTAELNRLKAETEAYGLQVSDTAQELEKRQSELKVVQKNAERVLVESQSLKEKVNSEVQEARNRDLEKAKMEYLEKVKQLDGELAQRRLEEERQLESLRKKAEGALVDHKKALVLAVSRKVIELVGPKLGQSKQDLERIEKEIREASTQAMDLDHNSMPKTEIPPSHEAKKAKEFWIRTGISAASVCAVVFLLVLFPDLPKKLAGKAYRAVSSDKADNVFLSEIKKKGEHVQFETTPEFRDNYTDNVLYAQAYVKVKTDEAIQRKWTLALNDFFIGRLGLDDRVIVDFMSAEAAMVNGLSQNSDRILPQFKDMEIEKLRQTEAIQLLKLKELLGGDQNYKKFRDFERSFYLDQINSQKNRT